MSAYKGGMDYSADTDAAQAFLSDKLSKNKYNSSEDYSTEGFDPSSYTAEQMANLSAFGGPKKFGKKSYETVSNQSEIDSAAPTVTGGGTERYADYANSNDGGTQFSDAWVDGAKYQQLRGTGSLNNDAFNAQFEAAQGGDATKTVADDGGGWKLIKQDEGEKSEERKLEYKDLAEQWQAAGYDVRVQDHNPDFEGGTGEIAVRVSGAKDDAPEPIIEDDPVVHSPEIQQAKERVGKYENDVLSGKTSQQIYGGADKFYDGYNLNLMPGSPSSDPSANYQFNTQAPQLGNKYEFKAGNTSFNGSDIAPEYTPPKKEQATASFLDNQKKKVIKEKNIKPAL